jgi:hypothetical protein
MSKISSPGIRSLQFAVRFVCCRIPEVVPKSLRSCTPGVMVMHHEALVLQLVCRYVKDLMAESKDDVRHNGQSVNLNGYHGNNKVRYQRPPRPNMREQMALSMKLTERLPQRYCIQNHLGVSCWYWTPTTGPHASMKKFKLPSGESQQMRCEPHHSQVVMEQTEGGRVCIIPLLSIKLACLMILCLG